MNLDIFRKNLRIKLKERSLTLNSLSELSELSEDTLRSIIYGNSHDIRLSTAFKLADVFACTVDELFDHDPYPAQKKRIIDKFYNLPESSMQFIKTLIELEEKCLYNISTNGKVNIPVFNPKTTLKDGMYYDRNSIIEFDISEYPEPIQKETSFGLKIQSSSYEPVFYPNDILLFSADTQPNYHDVVLIINDNEELFIKRYTQLGFESLKKFGKIMPHNDSLKFRILGVYIRAIQVFDIEQYR